MKPILGLIAQGAMGSGVGARLVEKGLTVWTVLEGRSEASVKRAADAGMVGVPKEEMANVDIFLSVVPPAEAEALATWLSPVLTYAPKKPVYVDLNAVSPKTVKQVAAAVEPTGCLFADGGIIGNPPARDAVDPAIYVSGPGASRVADLAPYGLDLRIMDAPVGAASAVKLSYAGITKGFTAMSSMMILAATRYGAADYLARELNEKATRLMGQISANTPKMYDKAYRFGPEMLEISDYVADDHAAREVYRFYAEFYERIAEDHKGPSVEVGALKALIAKLKK